jgi:peptidyl-tRNA hydrolase, PTH1 family
MKLIVGLGNPGNEYQSTRHNAGWMVIDRLANRHAPTERVRARFHADTIDCQIGPRRVMLIKPTTYMNRSGLSVAEAVNFFKVDPVLDLLVVSDETALDVGVLRLRAGGGENGHNGLKDIRTRLGTDQYPRLRFGVGTPHAGENKASYVLGRFGDLEASLVASAVDRAADASELWAAEGIEAAMNRFNTRPEGSGWGRDAQEEQSPNKNPSGAVKAGSPSPPSAPIPPNQSEQRKNHTDIDPGWFAG